MPTEHLVHHSLSVDFFDDKEPFLTVDDNPHAVRPDVDNVLHYDRRMSSSSSADTDDSNKHHRPSPEPRKADDAKVQLPSISTTFEDHRRSVRHSPYPAPTIRGGGVNGLSSYTFPPVPEDPEARRPSRLTTDVYPYDSQYSGGGDAKFIGISPYSESDTWAGSPGIVRPSSTPGQLASPPLKYDDGMRHASFSAGQMFAGSARISGQDSSRSRNHLGVKNEWQFTQNDFVLPQQNGNGGYSPPLQQPAPPQLPSSNRSPQQQPQGGIPSQSQLVDRPQRKRGKLPKETTDYLKSWLHRHSDHPYPSEEEKKQLCHATGLSMSQVSNWMINARRRILAPAHRAASGPTTTAPFPPSGRSASLSGLLDPVRRASMPSQDTLQLYHPMSLQSMPNTPSSHHHGHHGEYRIMSGMRGSHSHHGGGHHMNGHPVDYSNGHGHRYEGGHSSSSGRGQLLYVPNNSHHSGSSNGHHHSSNNYDVPLSAPPTLSGNPFSGGAGGGGGGGGGGGYSPPRLPSAQAGYFENAGSAPGSGYGTPQPQ